MDDKTMIKDATKKTDSKSRMSVDTKKPLSQSAMEFVTAKLGESEQPKPDTGESEQLPDPDLGESSTDGDKPGRLPDPKDNPSSDFPPEYTPQEQSAFKPLAGTYRGTGNDPWIYAVTETGGLIAIRGDAGPGGMKSFEVDRNSKAGKAILDKIKSNDIVKA